MGWINTTNRDLINASCLQEIKLFNLEYKDKLLGTEILGVMPSNTKYILGYTDSPEDAEEALADMIHRQFYKFSYSFRDLCEKNADEIIELENIKDEKIEEDKSKYTQYFEEYWNNSVKIISRIYTDCTKEEIEIDFYL